MPSQVSEVPWSESGKEEPVIIYCLRKKTDRGKILQYLGIDIQKEMTGDLHE